MSSRIKPIIVVGAGPVGLTTALGLNFYGLPFLLFEDDAELSRDTKAGTILTRTLEAFRRYGVADQVLAKALRVAAGSRVPDGRRRASDHADVGARPQHRNSRCD
jgi:2-polyprenyl-6-methoxyphenol hydroxylase-like FAD-dependent oxidoreductase